MSDSRRHLGRALALLGGSVLASSLLQYALLFCVVAHLGAEAYGGFSLAWTIALLAAPFCDLGTNLSIVATGAQRADRLLPAFVASLWLRLFAAVPVGAAGLAVGWLCGFETTFAPLFVPLFAASLADGVGTLCSSVCQVQQRVAVASVLLLSRNLLRAAALLVTLCCDGGAAALAWSFAAASLLGTIPAIAIARGGRRLPSSRGDLLPTLRHALPFGLSVQAALLQANVGVALLGAFHPADEVGRYHAASRFVLVAMLVPQVVAMASGPLSYRIGLRGTAGYGAFHRVKTSALALLGMLGTLTMLTAAGPLTQWCLGPKFAGTEPLLVATGPLLLVKFLSSSLADALSAVGRLRRLVVGMTLALALQVVAALAWMPEHGALGAVAATVVSETFLLVFLAATLHLAGLDLAPVAVLAHPLVAAGAAALALVAAGPQFALPAAVVTAIALVLRWPTPEERLLLARPVAAAGPVAAASPVAAAGPVAAASPVAAARPVATPDAVTPSP